jgi:hypothetical protein
MMAIPAGVWQIVLAGGWFAWQAPDVERLVETQSQACELSQRMAPAKAFMLFDEFQRISKSKDFRFDRQTDQSWVYERFGSPDETESGLRSLKGSYPMVRWTYRCSQGHTVFVEFLDRNGTGDFRAADYGVTGGRANNSKSVFYSHGSGSPAVVEVTSDKKILVTVPIEFPAKEHAIAALIVSADGATNYGYFETRVACGNPTGDSGCRGFYHTAWEKPLPPGSYILSAVVEDPANLINSKTYIVNLTVETQ